MTEYHPSLPQMGGILRKHWLVMVQRDERLRQCFPQPSMVAYKRGQSLKELLFRARMPNRNVRRSERQAEKQGFSNCGWVCGLCPFAKSTKQHTLSGRTFTINGVITCLSSGCCYRIGCQKCPEWLYIGETGNMLKTRFGQHKGDILNMRSTPSSRSL